MEYLRWILLVAGIFFVLIIYFVGRRSRQQDHIYDSVSDEDPGEFSTDEWDNDWHDQDDDVGEVRIVARENNIYANHDDFEAEESVSSYDAPEGDLQQVGAAEQNDKEDIIVLHILARASNRLAGDKINSAAQASSLKFGDMNIFHRLDENDRSVFGMANMVEPGYFDPDTILELETPGLTLFMQQSNSKNHVAVFEDMLKCAYQISEMLGAQLCNKQRQPITQTDAERYRELAAGFDE